VGLAKWAAIDTGFQLSVRGIAVARAFVDTTFTVLPYIGPWRLGPTSGSWVSSCALSHPCKAFGSA